MSVFCIAMNPPTAHPPALAVLSTGLAVLFAGCTAQSDSASAATSQPPPPANFDESALPAPSEPGLAGGQQVWRNHCQLCHGSGYQGMPEIGDRQAWEPRIAKGMEMLIENAIQGFWGQAGYFMPPRGGNDQLTDPQIAAAVAYMVHHSRPAEMMEDGNQNPKQRTESRNRNPEPGTWNLEPKPK